MLQFARMGGKSLSGRNWSGATGGFPRFLGSNRLLLRKQYLAGRSSDAQKGLLRQLDACNIRPYYREVKV